MKFAPCASAAADGGILARTVRVDGRKWKKGRLLTAADCEALTNAGITEILVAMPEAGDIAEDAAAQRLAAIFRGTGVRAGKPFTGRVNLFSTTAGLLHFDAEAVHRLNAVSPCLTAATLPADTPVAENDILATIKIIPYALPEQLLAQVETSPVAFAVAPFVRQRIALIQTMMDENPAIADKTAQVTAARLAAFDASLTDETRVAHECEALKQAITTLVTEKNPQVLLIAGAQAVADECDTLPAAIVAAGGTLTRVGMPVDPGNLLLLAQLGNIPVIGLPGCARSPKLNGFDWVLNRVLAGLPLDAAMLGRWGVGGLLADTRERPLPRVAPRPVTGGAALLLAAGAARRMGGDNKLLQDWRGKPLLTHAVTTLQAARTQGLIGQIIAVTGRDHEAVTALLPADFIRVHNPDYESGMASSLNCAAAALDGAPETVLVFLGDMPRVAVSDIAALHETMAATGVTADVIVPEHRGKRGNPVLLHRRMLPRLRRLSGDEGARALFGEVRLRAAAVGDGVLYDVDTPAAFADGD